jgi:predicted ATPase
MVKFTFLEDVRTFKKGEVITLDNANTLLVGDNGCGKSTLLQLLWLYLPHEEYELETYENQHNSYIGRWEYNAMKNLKDKVVIETDYEVVYVCDSILKLRNLSKHLDEGGVLDFKIGLNISNASHGEITKIFYIKTTDEMIERREKENFAGGKALLLLDEVEVGLSIKTQCKLPNSLLAVVEDGNFDILVSTHNIPVITDNRYNCFDVENRKYVDGNEYVNSLKVTQKIGNK